MGKIGFQGSFARKRTILPVRLYGLCPWKSDAWNTRLGPNLGWASARLRQVRLPPIACPSTLPHPTPINRGPAHHRRDISCTAFSTAAALSPSPRWSSSGGSSVSNLPPTLASQPSHARGHGHRALCHFRRALVRGHAAHHARTRGGRLFHAHADRAGRDRNHDYWQAVGCALTAKVLMVRVGGWRPETLGCVFRRTVTPLTPFKRCA